MRQIPLSQGLMTLVDDADYERLAQYRWYACKDHRKHYAKRSAGNQKLLMHRVILGLRPGDGIQSDHRDGNGLNNQRENLRTCTNAENGRNRVASAGLTSAYLGVSLDRNKWRAQSKLPRSKGGLKVSLGWFDSEEDAARAYDRFAIEHFGEFANPNFPIDRQATG